MNPISRRTGDERTPHYHLRGKVSNIHRDGEISDGTP